MGVKFSLVTCGRCGKPRGLRHLCVTRMDSKRKPRRTRLKPALSVTCPHLGCGIEKSANGFGCPCHASAFDATGKRVSGPSPRDMDPVEARAVGDKDERWVEVRFLKFRQGVPEREEIG